MNKFNIKIFIFIIIILSLSRTSYSAFEDISGGGARPLGMGGAYVALAEGGENTCINPAGLGFLGDDIHLGIMYSPLFMGLDDGSLYRVSYSTAKSFEHIGGFAFHYQHLGVSTEQINNIYQENVYMLSYGRSFNKKIAAGINLKYLSWAAAESVDFTGYKEKLSKKNFSFDLGLLYNVIKEITLGLNVTDINQPFINEIQNNDDTSQQRIGIKFGLTVDLKTDWLLALDCDYCNRKSDFHIGTEYWLWKKIGARTGFCFMNIILGIDYTAGLSFKIKQFMCIDYAFVYPLITIRSTWGIHRFSASFKL